MKLTTEEAIEELNDMLAFEIDEFGEAPVSEEAVDMAINALKERKTGKWEKDIYGNVVCSECKRKPICGNLTAYCPHCGAKMEVEAWEK